MFKRFKISKNLEGAPESPLGRFSGKVNSVQHKWADQLQERSERLSSAGKWAFLCLFMIIFGGGSIFIAWQAIICTRPEAPIPINRITPANTGGANAAKESFPDGRWVPTREYNAIIFFRHYLDSLGETEKGEEVRDSILADRPGLLDSLDVLESMYLMQSKK